MRIEDEFNEVDPKEHNGLKSWLHKTESIWVTYYPNAPDGPIYEAYKAVAHVPEGRKPWTIANRRIQQGDAGFVNIEEAFDAAIVAANKIKPGISFSPF